MNGSGQTVVMVPSPAEKSQFPPANLLIYKLYTKKGTCQVFLMICEIFVYLFVYRLSTCLCLRSLWLPIFLSDPVKYTTSAKYMESDGVSVIVGSLGTLFERLLMVCPLFSGFDKHNVLVTNLVLNCVNAFYIDQKL